MKVRIDFWQVVVSSYYGVDKMADTDIETYLTKEDAEASAKDWLQSTEYATNPEGYDDSFPGRTFEFNRSTNEEGTIGTIERVTDVPEEYFYRYVYITRDRVEKDVPLVFDMKDITKIQLFTKDET